MIAAAVAVAQSRSLSIDLHYTHNHTIRFCSPLSPCGLHFDRVQLFSTAVACDPFLKLSRVSLHPVFALHLTQTQAYKKGVKEREK